MKAILFGRQDGALRHYQLQVAAGLMRHGVEIIAKDHPGVDPRWPKADFTICWGWRRGASLQRAGYRVLVLERAYIGDRFHYTSLGWDGLNGRADFCLPAEPMPARFDRHFTMEPWRSAGDRILIMGQVPGDMSLEGRDMTTWYHETAKAAAAFYGLPVLFRPHPVAVAKGIMQDRGDAGGPLVDELKRAAGIVTWNSNSAVDAVLAGVPAITLDPGSMAWPVSRHSIGEMIRPDRAEWANRLAWCQWSPDELAKGDWWERMKKGIA